MIPPFGFAAPRAIRFGRGEALAAAGDVAALAPRLLLVHGADPARSAPLREALEGRGAAVEAVACRSEPDLPALERGLEALRGSGAGAVVSLGGGAAIDLGKALAALGPASGPAMDHLEVVGRGMPLEADPLPLAALPTTAGTGAEVTRNAVLGVPEARRKVSLRDPRMLARLAVVDPSLTDGAPRAVTLGSGLDAVTQVVEPYLSRRANPLTDALCRAAIPRGMAALVRLMEGEDDAARDDLAWCSLAGGLALSNAGLGAVHGLAGPIGGRAPGAPHGAVCGVLLPHVLERNAREATGALAGRIEEVRRWIGAALGAPAGEAPAALAAWSRDAGLPRLSAMGLDPAEAGAVAEDAMGSSSMKGNPVDLAAADLRAVLEAAA